MGCGRLAQPCRKPQVAETMVTEEMGAVGDLRFPGGEGRMVKNVSHI